MSCYRLLLVLSFLVGLAPAGRTEDTLTIERAVQIGLKNNFSIRVARNRARIAAHNTGKGTAAFLPGVDAAGNVTRSETDVTTNSPFSFGDSDTRSWGAQVSFAWTLFDGFGMFADRERYRVLARLGDYEARNLIENAVVQISRAYFDLIQQERLLEVARSTRDISRDRFEREKVRNELGGASSTDLFNAQVAYNSDEAARLNQELRTDVARQDLNILLGRDPATPVTVSREFGIRRAEWGYDELLARAEKDNSALRLAEENRAAALQDLRLKRRPFFPRLALTGSYGYSDRTVSSSRPDFTGDITTEETSASIGLVLTYNLFNGRRDFIDLQNARLELENRRLEHENAQNELRGLVRERLQTFRQRLRIIELEEENVRAARRNLDLQLDRFELGVATSLEFRDAQVSFARAQDALIVAQFQARLARLEIEQLTGAIPVQ